MHEGFVVRAEAVSRLLRDPRTTFMVVTTLEAVPAREAQVFVDLLRQRRLHLGMLVCNKVLPEYLSHDAPGAVAVELRERAHELAAELARTKGRPASLAEVAQVERVLGEVGGSFSNFQLVARREAELFADMADAHEVTATVPYLDTDITDLAGVLRLGEQILGSTADDGPGSGP